MQTTPLKTVLDIFKCQIIASGIALILVAIFVRGGVMSFFLGALVMLLGNGFLARRVYRQNKRLAPMPMLWGFLGGETGKYVLLLILTFVIAKTIALNWLFYVIGIAVPQLFGVVVYMLWLRIKIKR